jgi:thiol-disulfide isomerase/thioredoxin
MTRRRRFQLLTALAVAAAIAIGGAVIDHALQESGDHPVSAAGFDALFRSGVQHLERGETAPAVAAFEKALALRPEIVEARVNLGYALLGVSMDAAAEKAFRTAIEQRPRQVNAYFGLAESLESRNDMAGALGAMRTYVHLSAPDDPYRRRAMAAIWEWETALADRRSIDKSKEDGSDNDLSAVLTDADPLDQISKLPAVDPESPMAVDDLGGKVIVLNVWATWCPPCRRELPLLQAMSERLDDSRAAVVGLSIDEDIDLVREFLRDLGVRYPNYIDNENRIAAGMLEVQSYPQTLVFGPDGAIIRRFVGVGASDGQEVVDAIESLVGSLVADKESPTEKEHRS